MGVIHRRRVRAGGDQARDVRDVGHEVGADLVGNGAEPGEVDGPRVGAGPADDQLGAEAQGLLPDGVVVQQEGVRTDAVVLDLEELARKGNRGPVRDVAALVHGLAEDAVPFFEERRDHDLIGAGARVRLDIGVPGLEDLPGPADGEGLQAIHDLAAAVEAGAGEAFRRLVLHDGPQGGQDGPRALVLRRDKLQRVLLAVVLLREELVDLPVGGLQDAGQTSDGTARCSTPSGSTARRLRRQASGPTCADLPIKAPVVAPHTYSGVPYRQWLSFS